MARFALRTLLATTLAIAVTGLAAGEAAARIKTIPPSLFQEGRPHVNATDFVRTPGYIESGPNPDGALFVAKVRLPAGSRITGARLSGQASTGFFYAFFGRKKLAGPEQAFFFHAFPATEGTWTLYPLALDPATDPVVAAGYTYYLAVTVLGNHTRFGGVQIIYR